MRLSHRLSRLRDRLTSSFPPACTPLVVLAADATPDRPPGRWVRADGATVGVRLADGQPFPALPGDPLVIGGEIDAEELLAGTATFVPDIPAQGARPRGTRGPTRPGHRGDGHSAVGDVGSGRVYDTVCD